MILAPTALTILRALHARIETLTVLLLALRLLTSALPLRHPGRHPGKRPRFPKIRHLLCQYNLPLMSYTILTSNATARRATDLPTCEALTVEFEAPDFRALAALGGDLGGEWFLNLHYFFGGEGEGGLPTGVEFVDELLEEVPGGVGVPVDLVEDGLF